MIGPSFGQFPDRTKRNKSSQQGLDPYPTDGNNATTFHVKHGQVAVDRNLRLLHHHKLMQQPEFVFFMTRERLERVDLLFFITVLLLFIYYLA